MSFIWTAQCFKTFFQLKCLHWGCFLHRVYPSLYRFTHFWCRLALKGILIWNSCFEKRRDAELSWTGFVLSTHSWAQIQRLRRVPCHELLFYVSNICICASVWFSFAITHESELALLFKIIDVQSIFTYFIALELPCFEVRCLSS